MKRLLRSYLVNLGALGAVSTLIPALQITDGLRGWLVGALAFMVLNIVLVPFLRILLLPLNLLTLGLFTWLSNVLALYFLTAALPSFKLLPYQFVGADIGGFVIPALTLTPFQVAIAASFLIGFIIHFINWLVK